MKRLFTVLLLMYTFALSAQTYLQPNIKKQPDALYISIQPVDYGIGLKYDHIFNNVIGAYSSLSYGDWGLYKRYGLRGHIKGTFGVILPWYDRISNHFAFLAGVNYHYLSQAKIKSVVISPKILNPWSFELGITIKLKRFAMGIRTDILRWEPCLDIGYIIKR